MKVSFRKLHSLVEKLSTHINKDVPPSNSNPRSYNSEPRGALAELRIDVQTLPVGDSKHQQLMLVDKLNTMRQEISERVNLTVNAIELYGQFRKTIAHFNSTTFCGDDVINTIVTKRATAKRLKTSLQTLVSLYTPKNTGGDDASMNVASHRLAELDRDKQATTTASRTPISTVLTFDAMSVSNLEELQAKIRKIDQEIESFDDALQSVNVNNFITISDEQLDTLTKLRLV